MQIQQADFILPVFCNQRADVEEILEILITVEKLQKAEKALDNDLFFLSFRGQTKLGPVGLRYFSRVLWSLRLFLWGLKN